MVREVWPLGCEIGSSCESDDGCDDIKQRYMNIVVTWRQHSFLGSAAAVDAAIARVPEYDS
jgi:hypothetical protein